jgi:hypothetical protein
MLSKESTQHVNGSQTSTLPKELRVGEANEQCQTKGQWTLLSEDRQFQSDAD